jgi:hypothetical protein
VPGPRVDWQRCWDGWLYVAVVLDAFSRRIVVGSDAEPVAQSRRYLRGELVEDLVVLADFGVEREPAPTESAQGVLRRQLRLHSRCPVGLPGPFVDRRDVSGENRTIDRPV